MPCPHCKITIIKRSNNESAVSAAAYQSGEKLFSEYDQEQKYYPYKNEVTHKEIMLPPHVPPEFADRNTLWNSAEAQEKQWNSQLARRFVLAMADSAEPPRSVEEVKAMLETTEKGGFRNSMSNCLTVFQCDPLLSGAVAYNLLTDRTDILKPIGYKRTAGSPI